MNVRRKVAAYWPCLFVSIPSNAYKLISKKKKNLIYIELSRRPWTTYEGEGDAEALRLFFVQTLADRTKFSISKNLYVTSTSRCRYVE